MDSNRKRKGFMKTKLMPFYRTASKPSTNVQYSSNKVKPSQNSYTPTANSIGYVVHHQDMVFSPAKPSTVSFIVPAEHANRHEKLSKLDKLIGVIGDESVDLKADSYISFVQERFKLERTYSERVKVDDMK